jgi:hypothetical protein
MLVLPARFFPECKCDELRRLPCMENHAVLTLAQLKLKLIYDRQSVGQSVLVSGAHLEPLTNFSFSSKFPSDICVFVIL